MCFPRCSLYFYVIRMYIFLITSYSIKIYNTCNVNLTLIIIVFSVTQPMMYDLPNDDAFRPLLANHLPEFHDTAQLQDLQDLPPLPQVDHPDVVPGGDVIRVRGGHLLPGEECIIRVTVRYKVIFRALSVTRY